MPVRLLALLLAACCAMPAYAQKEPTAPKEEPAAIAPKEADAGSGEAAVHYDAVVLQGLNKVTGHISRLEGKLESVMRFGNLEITAHRCWKPGPEERPEDAALLEIRELVPGELPKQIFLGWMFSSSPGLSSLEHPVYDVTVVSCETAKAPEEPAKKPTEK